MRFRARKFATSTVYINLHTQPSRFKHNTQQPQRDKSHIIQETFANAYLLTYTVDTPEASEDVINTGSRTKLSSSLYTVSQKRVPLLFLQ